MRYFILIAILFVGFGLKAENFPNSNHFQNITNESFYKIKNMQRDVFEKEKNILTNYCFNQISKASSIGNNTITIISFSDDSNQMTNTEFRFYKNSKYYNNIYSGCIPSIIQESAVCFYLLINTKIKHTSGIGSDGWNNTYNSYIPIHYESILYVERFFKNKAYKFKKGNFRSQLPKYNPDYDLNTGFFRFFKNCIMPGCEIYGEISSNYLEISW